MYTDFLVLIKPSPTFGSGFSKKKKKSHNSFKKEGEIDCNLIITHCECLSIFIKFINRKKEKEKEKERERIYCAHFTSSFLFFKIWSSCVFLLPLLNEWF